MTNRFNKGIKELKQTETAQETDAQPASEQELTIATTKPFIDKKQSKDNIKENTLNNATDNINYNVQNNILDNILDNILSNEPIGANFTFYLSDEVSKVIAKVAKEKKISKSKLVDTILKQVLLSK